MCVVQDIDESLTDTEETGLEHAGQSNLRKFMLNLVFAWESFTKSEECSINEMFELICKIQLV